MSTRDRQSVLTKCPLDWGRSQRGFLEKRGGEILKKINFSLKNCLPGKPGSLFVDRYERVRKEWYGKVTRPYFSGKELCDELPVCQRYIVGSDQVWHPRVARNDSTFFLDFLPQGRPRLSFASSFGVLAVPAELERRYQFMLSGFNKISVRESSAVRIIKKLTGKDAILALDPTLLLTERDWSAESVKPRMKRPYILCYGENSKSLYMERLASSIRKKTGWDIVRLNGKFYHYFSKGMEYVLDAGPREWLGYFLNARFIIGQSFHATVFAVNFRKPFVSLLRGDPDHDLRQKEFLALVGLTSRMICCGDPIESVMLKLSLDVPDLSCYEKIEKLRSDSLSLAASFAGTKGELVR